MSVTVLKLVGSYCACEARACVRTCWDVVAGYDAARVTRGRHRSLACIRPGQPMHTNRRHESHNMSRYHSVGHFGPMNAARRDCGCRCVCERRLSFASIGERLQASVSVCECQRVRRRAFASVGDVSASVCISSQIRQVGLANVRRRSQTLADARRRAERNTNVTIAASAINVGLGCAVRHGGCAHIECTAQALAWRGRVAWAC